jgi:cytochrome c oxidase assembly protein subunit 15
MMKKNFNHKYTSYWIFLVCLLILTMIGIGGYTRLTNSGLSIVEWKPVTGIWYPMTEQSWLAEFAKYQLSPEFKFINFSISLEEFKNIYFVEYFHRLFGRMLGIVFLLPLIYFAWKKYFHKNDIYKFIGVLLLVVMQACVGWYMVSSGLVNDPHVSHFRLSFHLIMAIVIFGILFWQGLNYLSNNFDKNISIFNAAGLMISMVMIQVFYGGLVAGLDAGLVYNQFPLMGESLIPKELHEHSLLEIMFYNQATVQFIHRCLASLILLTSFYFVYKNWKKNIHSEIYLLVFLSVLVQYSIGVITLLTGVKIDYALVHQLLALLVISNLLLLKCLG